MKVFKHTDGCDFPVRFIGRIEFEDGRICYVKRNRFHRVDGPAIIDGSYLQWCYKGIMCKHKEDWFKLLTTEQKIAALCNPENW